MTTPPIYNFRDLGSDAQMLSKNFANERMAMICQYVALGSMIIMAGATSVHLMKEMFGHTDHRDRSR